MDREYPDYCYDRRAAESLMRVLVKYYRRLTGRNIKFWIEEEPHGNNRTLYSIRSNIRMILPKDS